MMPTMRHPFGMPWQLRQKAASAAVRAAAIGECLTAGCKVGYGCKAQHEPCPEMSGQMFHAGQDLVALRAAGGGSRQIPADLLQAVERYVKFMLVDYGPDD